MIERIDEAIEEAIDEPPQRASKEPKVLTPQPKKAFSRKQYIEYRTKQLHWGEVPLIGKAAARHYLRAAYHPTEPVYRTTSYGMEFIAGYKIAGEFIESPCSCPKTAAYTLAEILAARNPQIARIPTNFDYNDPYCNVCGGFENAPITRENTDTVCHTSVYFQCIAHQVPHTPAICPKCFHEQEPEMENFEKRLHNLRKGMKYHWRARPPTKDSYKVQPGTIEMMCGCE